MQGPVEVGIEIQDARLFSEWFSFLDAQLRPRPGRPGEKTAPASGGGSKRGAAPAAATQLHGAASAKILACNRRLLVPALYFALSVDGAVAFHSSSFGFQHIAAARAANPGHENPPVLVLDRRFAVADASGDYLVHKSMQFAGNRHSVKLALRSPRSILGFHLLAVDDTTATSQDELLASRFIRTEEFTRRVGGGFKWRMRFDFPVPLSGTASTDEDAVTIDQLAKSRRYRRGALLLTFRASSQIIDAPAKGAVGDPGDPAELFNSSGTAAILPGPIPSLEALFSEKLRWRTTAVLEVSVTPARRSVCLAAPHHGDISPLSLTIRHMRLLAQIFRFWASLAQSVVSDFLPFGSSLIVGVCVLGSLLYGVRRAVEFLCSKSRLAEFPASFIRSAVLAGVCLWLLVNSAQRRPAARQAVAAAVHRSCFRPPHPPLQAEINMTEDDTRKWLEHMATFNADAGGEGGSTEGARGAAAAFSERPKKPMDALVEALFERVIPFEALWVGDFLAKSWILQYLLPLSIYLHFTLTEGRERGRELATAVSRAVRFRTRFPRAAPAAGAAERWWEAAERKAAAAGEGQRLFEEWPFWTEAEAQAECGFVTAPQFFVEHDGRWTGAAALALLAAAAIWGVAATARIAAAAAATLLLFRYRLKTAKK